MKNPNLIAGATAAFVGITIGVVTERVVTKKAPQLKPALTWVSGALVGVGAMALLAPALVTKSEAASILASD